MKYSTILWMAVASALTAAVMKILLAPAMGPYGQKASELQKLELAVNRESEAAFDCISINANIMVDQYRSANLIIELEQKNLVGEAELAAALSNLESFISRRRRLLDACKEAKKSGNWSREAHNEAVGKYLEQKQSADQAWEAFKKAKYQGAQKTGL